MPLRADPLDRVRKMVADAIQALGGDPKAANIAPDTWLVAKRSATVMVRLVPQAEADRSPYLQVVSPLMKVPAGNAWKDRLLDMNYEMGGLCTICPTPAGEIHLFSARTIDGITPTEVAQEIAQVAHFSDLYDDRLLDEFGRQYALRTEQRRASAPPPPAAKPPAKDTGKKDR